VFAGEGDECTDEVEGRIESLEGKGGKGTGDRRTQLCKDRNERGTNEERTNKWPDTHIRTHSVALLLCYTGNSLRSHSWQVKVQRIRKKLSPFDESQSQATKRSNNTQAK
jgi:hypothetical protein